MRARAWGCRYRSLWHGCMAATSHRHSTRGKGTRVSIELPTQHSRSGSRSSKFGDSEATNEATRDGAADGCERRQTRPIGAPGSGASWRSRAVMPWCSSMRSECRAEPRKGPEIGTLLKVDTEPSVALALVSALSSPMPSHVHGSRSSGSSRWNSSANCRRTRPAVRNHSAAAFPAIRRSAMSCSGPARTNSPRPMRAMPRPRSASAHIQQDSSIPAMVKIDELLGKHFAVLGTTGTGKSCAVALILRRILEKNPQAHILLLDRAPRICTLRSGNMPR